MFHTRDLKYSLRDIDTFREEPFFYSGQAKMWNMLKTVAEHHRNVLWERRAAHVQKVIHDWIAERITTFMYGHPTAVNVTNAVDFYRRWLRNDRPKLTPLGDAPFVGEMSLASAVFGTAKRRQMETARGSQH